MGFYDEDPEFRLAVEKRLDRPFSRVQEQLCAMFGRDWDDVESFISTSALKRSRDAVDVIEGLVAKAEDKPPVQQVVRRAVVKWIGKPWRERENPWDKYKGQVPGRPPPTSGEGEAWEPWKQSED
jgi:hypothetical protein